MTAIKWAVLMMALASIPVLTAGAQSPAVPSPAFDSSYVIPVRAGADAAAAYQRAVATLVAQGFAITGAVPGLALNAAATDNGSLGVNITLGADGMAYCSAQLPAADGGGTLMNGSGTIVVGGGRVIAVQRASRTGKAAWARLERLASALAQ